MNLAQLIGRLQLEAGFYGPADGAPLLARRLAATPPVIAPPQPQQPAPDPVLRQAVSQATAGQVAPVRETRYITGTTGKAKRVFDLLPFEEPGFSARDIKNRLPDMDLTLICAYLGQLKNVVRTGPRGAYRYHRRPA